MTKEMSKDMIFDVQLFAVDPEIYTATSSNETVTVGATAQYQKVGATTVKTIKPKKKNAPMAGVDAGAGNDTLVVTSAADNLSISGGRGDDSINITGHGTTGNKYIYNSGDGKDTIKGWDSDKDILIVDDAGYQTSMSADGRTFSIKVGSGSVSFEGLEYGKKVKVSVSGTAGVTEHAVTRLMEGTSSSEYMINLSTVSSFNTGSGDEQFTLNAKEGNDIIYNGGSYVSVNAGEGNDTIYIQNEADNKVTSNVSIRGGYGNDLIDVSSDYTVSAGTTPVTTYGGHVYEFGADDGRDSIVGFNSNDTITLVDVDVDSISADVDVNGNYIIYAGYTTIIIKKGDKELGGTTLNVQRKTTSNGSLVNATAEIYKNKLGATEVTTGVYTIPKKILLNNAGTAENYNNDYDNYTVDAAGGADVLTVSAKAASINAGASNDRITLTGGTNVDTTATDLASALVSANVVTVQGGYGNDYIDATADKAQISDEDETEVRASHIYQINRDSGRDSIMGFNPNDSIQFIDVTDTTIASTEISADFDTTGNFYVLYFGGSSVYLDVSNDYFKGNKKLNIVNKNGAVITNLDSALTKVSLDSSGEETTVPADTNDAALAGKKAVSWQYIVPKKLMGTRGADTAAKLTNVDDDFVVDALQGNDVIINEGASRVSINGGAGNDTIWLTNSTVVGETTGGATIAVNVYGEDISIYGGAGNDIIYDDAVDPSATVASEDEDAQFGHAYIFGAYDGNDSVYFFGTQDSIYIDKDAELVNSSVSGNNLIINVGPKDGGYKTASMTLVDYIVSDNDMDKAFKLAQWDTTQNKYVSEVMFPPRLVNGTTGNDVLTNDGERYTIQAYGGYDSITNKEAGSSATIDAGAGNDTINNAAEKVSIDASYGNDIISLASSANANTIIAGYGNDSIFGSDGGKQLYVFGADEGINYITNFQTSDVIKTTGIDFDTLDYEITNEGFVLVLGNKDNYSATRIVIKGALNTDDPSFPGEPGEEPVPEDPDELTPEEQDAINAYNTRLDAYNNYARNVNNYKNIEANLKIKLQTYEKGAAIADTDPVEYEYAYQAKTITVPNQIVGTNAAETITVEETVRNATVSALAGYDSILSTGSNVSINAGIGNDTINLVDGTKNASGNTVYGGYGEDVIYSSGMSNLFQYNATYGEGKDTIYGFSEQDTITITSGTYSEAKMTADGFKIFLGDGWIVLPDVKGGDKLHIYDSEHTARVTVDSTAFGTNTNDTAELGESFGGYLYKALNGDDLITVASDAYDLTVDAGAGNDTIEVQGGNNITIIMGNGYDTVNTSTDVNEGRVFVFDAWYQGVNVINGIREDDTIRLDYTDFGINGIYKTEFIDDYFVITLKDEKTVIRLKEGTDTEGKYQRPGVGTKSFKLQIQKADGSYTTEPYDIPFIQEVEGTDAVTFNELYDKSVLIGDSAANKITINGASEVSIDAGIGNDTIDVQAGENLTITGGLGNDSINLKTDTHVYNYRRGDGNDSITGWAGNSILDLTGFASGEITTLMTGSNGDIFQISLPGGSITFNGEAVVPGQTEIIISGLSDITGNHTISVPKIITGKASADVLVNTEDNYEINALGGADRITNSGSKVKIDAGAGKDTVHSSEGDSVTILGGGGADSIKVDAGNLNSIDGGDGADRIILGEEVIRSTINAGAGNDVIFGNVLNNTFYYKSGDGSDTIYGFHNGDKLQIQDVAVSTVTGSDGSTPIAKVEVNENGLVINLKDGKQLTLKGARKSTAAIDSQDPGDFEFLNGTDNFNITTLTSTVIGGEKKVVSGTLLVEIPNQKNTTKYIPFENYTKAIKIVGTPVSDTITNYQGADNVTVDAGGYADIIKNEADNVSINAGAGNDKIYFGNAYAYDETAHEDTVEVEVPSHALRVTVNAGTGDDTIWGNSNGGHLYKYADGDGNDVIYSFGATDTIDLQGATYTTDIGNTTKHEAVKVDKKDGNNQLYSYTFFDSNDLGEYTAATRSLATQPKVDGTGNEYYVAKTTAATSRTGEFTLKQLKKESEITGNESDYIAVNYYVEGGKEVYKTDTSRVIATTTKQNAEGKNVYVKLNSIAAVEAADGVVGSDDTTTNLAEAAKAIRYYWGTDGEKKYTATSTKVGVATALAETANGNHFYLRKDAGLTLNTTDSYTEAQVSSDAAEVATFVNYYVATDSTKRLTTLDSTTITTANQPGTYLKLAYVNSSAFDGDNGQGVIAANATSAMTTTNLADTAQKVSSYKDAADNKIYYTTDSTVDLTTVDYTGHYVKYGTDITGNDIASSNIVAAADIATSGNYIKVKKYEDKDGVHYVTANRVTGKTLTTQATTKYIKFGVDTKDEYIDGTDLADSAEAAAISLTYYYQKSDGTLVYTDQKSHNETTSVTPTSTNKYLKQNKNIEDINSTTINDTNNTVTTDVNEAGDGYLIYQYTDGIGEVHYVTSADAINVTKTITHTSLDATYYAKYGATAVAGSENHEFTPDQTDITPVGYKNVKSYTDYNSTHYTLADEVTNKTLTTSDVEKYVKFGKTATDDEYAESDLADTVTKAAQKVNYYYGTDGTQKYTVNATVTGVQTADAKDEGGNQYYVKIGQKLTTATTDNNTTAISTTTADFAQAVKYYYDVNGVKRYITNATKTVTTALYNDNGHQYYIKTNKSITNGTKASDNTDNVTTNLDEAATALNYYYTVEADDSKLIHYINNAEAPRLTTGEFTYTADDGTVYKYYARLKDKDGNVVNVADGADYTRNQISELDSRVAVMVKTYTDADDTEHLTTKDEATIATKLFKDGSGEQWYLKSGLAADADVTDKTNWTTNINLADATPKEIKYYIDEDGNEVYTLANSHDINGQKVQEDVWQEVDDPYHKDVIIKVGTGTITLKNLSTEEDFKVHLTNVGAASDTKQEAVTKIHNISRTEATSDNAFENTIDEYIIKGNAAGNNVINSGAGASINVSAGGENTITNTAADVTIQTSNSADTITTTGDGVKIYAGEGRNKITVNEGGSNSEITSGKDADTITNSASGVSINAGSGENKITNSGEAAQISTGADNDTITNTANDVTISTGSGNDSIDLSGSKNDGVIVDAGEGDDTITANTTGGRIYILNPSSGNDVIYNWTDADILKLSYDSTAGEAYEKEFTSEGIVVRIYKVENDVKTVLSSVRVTKDYSGTDGPVEGGKEFYIYDKDNHLLEYFTTPYIKYADEENTLTLSAISGTDNETGYTIQGTEASNTIDNRNDYSTILADAGADTIFTSGNYVSVNGGADNDLIVLATGSMYDTSTNKITNGNAANVKGVSISGGTGDDTIVANDDGEYRTGNMVIYQYSEGDGNDVIKGFRQEDMIYITGNYSTTIDSSNNFIINVMNENDSVTGSIKLQGYEHGKEVQIAKYNSTIDDYEPSEVPYIVPELVTINATTHTVDTDERSNVLINGENVAETITAGGKNTSIFANGGDDKIILSDDKVGIQVYAGAGNDTIQAALPHEAGVLYVFNNNENNNLIINFGENDSIKFNGTWDSTASGATLVSDNEETNTKDLILKLGNTIVTLQACGTEGSSIKVYDDTTTTTPKTVQIGKVIAGKDTADSLTNEDAEYVIQGYGGRDTIVNNASDVTISGGDQNDTITHVGTNSSIDGGRGDDVININVDTSQNTHSGGTKIVISEGSDQINNNDPTHAHTYQVNPNTSASAYINNFTANDIIQIMDDGATINELNALNAYSGEYLVLVIGSTTLYLRGTETNSGIVPGQALNIKKSDGTTAWAAVTVPYIATGTAAGETILSDKVSAFTSSGLAADATAAVTYDQDNYYVDAQAGADYIGNNKAGASIVANAGNDTINNLEGGTSASLVGGLNDDLIKNAANNVTIYAGRGEDTIENTGTTGIVYNFARGDGNVTIKGWNTGDTLNFEGLRNSNKPGEYSAYISQDYTKITLNTDDGNYIVLSNAADTALVDNDGVAPTINMKLGLETVDSLKTATLKPSIIQMDDGDLDTAFTSDKVGYTVLTGNGIKTINNTAANVYINANNGAGKKIINNNATAAADSVVSIFGSAVGDEITNNGTYASINAGAGNDTIVNKGGNSSIYGDAGNDDITNSVAAATIDAGLNNDIITNKSEGTNASIFGNYGDDTIINEASGATLYAGRGEDSIKNDASGAVTYYFARGDGNTTIKGWKTADTLYFEGLRDVNKPYTGSVVVNKTFDKVTLSTDDGNYIVFEGTFADSGVLKSDNSFKVSLGTETVDSLKSTTVDIGAITLTADAEEFENQNANVTVWAGAGDDTITNSADAKGAYISANAGGKKKIINNATGANVDEAVTILAGSADDTIEMGSTAKYASVLAGDGANTITSAGDNVSITTGRGEDKFTIDTGAENGWYDGGNGNDTFNISVGGGNSISGGADDDTFNIKSGANGNVYYYTGGYQGVDTFNGFTAYTDENNKGDTIYVLNGRAAISATAETETYETTATVHNEETDQDEEVATTATRTIGTRFYINDTAVILNDVGKTGTGKVTFSLAGTEKVWDISTGDWASAQVSEDEEFVMDDLFEDDSDTYVNDNTDNDLASIDYLDENKYSAGDIEDNNTEDLVQGNNATSAAFGKDDKQ